MKKKIIAFFAVLLLFCNFYIAAEENIKITLSSVSAQRDSAAWVDVKIENNTGLAAVTVSFIYDSSALEYTGYKEGILTDYSLKAYPSENVIRFVSLENSDIKKDGILLSLQFKVSADAEIKKYPITIEYSSGDFSNQNALALSPEIVSGGVEVIEKLTFNEESRSQAVSSPVDSSAANSGSSALDSTSSQKSSSSQQSNDSEPNNSSVISAVTSSEAQASSKPYISSESSAKETESNSNLDSLEQTDDLDEKQDFPINPILLIPAILIPFAFLFVIILKRKK